jgi:hypothetical protein
MNMRDFELVKKEALLPQAMRPDPLSFSDMMEQPLEMTQVSRDVSSLLPQNVPTPPPLPKKPTFLSMNKDTLPVKPNTQSEGQVLEQSLEDGLVRARIQFQKTSVVGGTMLYIEVTVENRTNTEVTVLSQLVQDNTLASPGQYGAELENKRVIKRVYERYKPRYIDPGEQRCDVLAIVIPVKCACAPPNG